MKNKVAIRDTFLLIPATFFYAVVLRSSEKLAKRNFKINLI